MPIRPVDLQSESDLLKAICEILKTTRTIKKDKEKLEVEEDSNSTTYEDVSKKKRKNKKK